MKTKHVLSLLAVGVACALFVGCSKSKNVTTGSVPVTTDSAGPVPMKLKWAVGKHYDQETTINQTVHLDFPGMKKPTDQVMNMTEDYTVSALKSLPDNGVELEIQFTGFKMQIKTGERVDIDFDSNSAQDQSAPKTPIQRRNNNDMAKVMSRIVGAKLKFDLDADGKVQQVIGMDEFKAQVSGGDPQVQAMLGGLMSEDTMKQMVGHNGGLPPTPVNVGDHWPVHLDYATTQAGNLNIDMKSTFTGWQQHMGRKCAVIEYVGTIITKPGTSGGPNNVSIEKGTTEGTTWFDPAMGMVVDNASLESMKLGLTVQGKAVTTAMKMSMNNKLVDTGDIEK